MTAGVVPGCVVRRVPDAATVAREAAEVLTRAAEQAVAARGTFALALSGGSTPRRLYALLADPAASYRGRFPWDRTHVFFGDERPVPADNPESNFRTANEALLRHVPVASVHRIHGEDPEAAEAYQAELSQTFGIPARGAPPRFDFILLGLGPDGHTASLFPGSPALAERDRWVVSPFVERLGTRRTSLTLPVLNRARAVVFLVSGAEKAGALQRVLAPEPGIELLPAARVRPEEGEHLWIVDAPAAPEGGAAERLAEPSSVGR